MKISQLTPRCRATLLGAAAMLGAPQLTSAIQMNVYVSTPSQRGTDSAFYLGHTVMASTPFNVLNAGGNYTVQCNHTATLPITGERTLASTTYGFDRNTLTVTIPAQQPAIRNLSGWLQIPDYTALSCNYRWTAFATEGGYSIGAGGISFPIGNGTVRDGDTVDFTMYRPSREDADGGCIP
ncbi:MAG TPA: hypothetical protein VEW08_09230 [Steroidobacteraceae bacterium]|nr:hypothetical protein [Steroidobacteraceae bacterium]